jgi:formylmethanofuran dehydrogenase subunit C
MKFMRSRRGRNPETRSRLALNGKFGRYKEEQEKAVREADVKEDDVPAKLLGAMAKSFELAKHIYDPGGIYDEIPVPGLSSIYGCYPFIHGIAYSKADIERLSMLIPDTDDELYQEFSSCFIEALVRMSRMDTYVLSQAQLEHRRKYLGLCNSEVLVVKGDVGEFLGLEMTEGLVVVEGSARGQAGEHMRGGALVVKGDCGEAAGYCMHDGLLIIEGNAGGRAGHYSSGGCILVKGDAGDAAGLELDEGHMVVEGNVGDDSGKDLSSTWSELYVFGNAGDFLGRGMKNGSIFVEGDAGRRVGEGMRGGRINIGGTFKSLGDIRGGDICLNDMLLVHEGELIGHPDHR